MKIKKNHSLKKHTTFSTDVKAKYFAKIKNIEELKEIEEVGVVLGETGASSNIFVYIIQSVLSLSTILSGIFFSKKYIM